MKKHFDTATLVVIALTLVLFLVALFVKGLTHDLLLEAGVFLVSVKLVLGAYKSGVHADAVERRLDAVQAALERIEARQRPEPPGS